MRMSLLVIRESFSKQDNNQTMSMCAPISPTIRCPQRPAVLTNNPLNIVNIYSCF